MTSPFDIQGHRGARGLLPENTIPAFVKALELGVTTLEMDVVISADSLVVVSHEPWFSSEICSLPSGEPVPVGEERALRIIAMPYAEVVRYDCGLRGHPRFPRQQRMPAVKPLLREVIETAEHYVAEHGRAPVFYNIETKSTPDGDDEFHPPPDLFARLLYDVLTERGVLDRAVIQSFDIRTLQAARDIDATWKQSLLIAKETPGDLAWQIETLGFTPDIYSPDFELLSVPLLARCHERGMAVLPWTVNTLEEMRRLKEMGVDGLITDYPDVGVRLLL